MYKFTIIRKANLFSRLAEIIQDITAHDEDYRICVLNEDVADVVLQAQLVEECRAEDINECPTCHGILEVSEKHIAICTKCGVEYDFSNPKTRFCFVRRELFIKFLGKSLNKQHNSDYGDLTHFGDINGRTVYYSYSPDAAFFSGHNMPNSAIIIGNHKVKVEPGWQGHPVYLRELFYIEDGTGKIRFTNMKEKLLPPIPVQAKTSYMRLTHDNTYRYLEFGCYLLCRPWNASDFGKNGEVKPSTIRKWYENTSNEDVAPCRRTFQRHLDAIYNAKMRSHDKTLRIVFEIFKLAYNLRDPEDKEKREACATQVSNYLCEHKQKEEQTGHAIEFGEQAFQYEGKDKRCRVNIANAHEEFYQDLDERMVL